MNRNIRVTGKGKVSVKPDTICLIIKVEGTYRDYDTTVKKSTEDTELLRATIERAGLNPKELKTIGFSIDSKYESYHDKNDNYKRRFVGYKYQHNARISFPNDNKQLGRLLYELANSKVKIEFSIRYTVKDVEAAKNELLAKAVEDSKIKADVLSKAASVNLGEIISIDYSWGEFKIYSELVDKMIIAEASPLSAGRSYDIDIEADDIDVQDTVTIVWAIVDTD